MSAEVMPSTRTPRYPIEMVANSDGEISACRQPAPAEAAV